MYGDYEYLCAMYGISGANGRHCCLWCSIKTDQLCIPKFIRGSFPKRSLDSLNTNLQRFRDNGSLVKNAKHYQNVIHDCFFNIPLEQVSIMYFVQCYENSANLFFITFYIGGYTRAPPNTWDIFKNVQQLGKLLSRS
ncbi:uncharacterized protein LOC130622074 [Hydractinia symbiolongicarpus]|uniref:uncharacterized protein LOC130622074 n=1 Tax=Hydractinia symbiolongicarpus TaxID=13093 RepID=UPI00254B0280|nr:uncharacterized protein LOC130622074 [Hydractinia symbiolongicarpus]